jgi:hypothetical protein
MIMPTPVLAMLAGQGVGKGLLRSVTNSSPIVQVRARRRRGRGGAAAAGAVILGLGLFSALAAAERQRVVDECLRRHKDVDPEQGVWYDRAGNAHPCP